MRPTRFGLHGALFYALMIGAFYAAPYSNLFFLLLGFLTLVGIAGAHAALKNLRALEVSLPELAPIPARTRSRASLELRAPGAPRFALEARIELEGAAPLEGRSDMLHGSTRLTLESAELERGCYPVRRALVRSSHPFGLLRVQHTFQAPSELVVYPTPHDLFVGHSPAQALDELLGRADPGGGDLQPSSLRDHREGDGVRGIHWRASARRGRLVVQEWEGGGGEGLEVVLDRRCSADELEDALSTLSAMVQLARTNKETLRLHSQGLSGTYGDGHAPWPEVLRFLASTEALPAAGPPPPAASPSTARLPRAPAHV